MGELPLLKLVEVLGVAVAGGAFVWWQLRDLKKAQETTRREREAAEASAARQRPDVQAAELESNPGLPVEGPLAEGAATPARAGRQDPRG